LVAQPAHHLGRGKFRAVVGSNIGRLAVQPHQARQGKDHVLRAQARANFDGQAFAV
jgi:hypothetical protein